MSYWTGGEEGYSFYESVAPYEAPPDPTIFERISDAIADIPKRPIALALLAAGGTAAVAWWVKRSVAAAKPKRLHVHALTGAQGGGQQLAGWVPTASDVEKIRRGVPRTLHLTHGPEPAPGTQVLLSAFPTESHLLAVESSLQALLVPFAGLPPRTEAALASSGLARRCAVHSVHHNAPMTAELAVALALAAAKQLIPADKQLRAGDWSARGIPSDGPPAPSVPMLLLSGQTCVVVGLGEVGSRVAVAMQALGMKVHATRASAARPGAVQLPGALRPVDVHPPAHLRALLPSAALLFVCVPGNAQTEGLIGERELRLLPRGAVLVNVGRGAVVDEAALFAALSPGPGGAPPHLLGAGVDVWYNYPATAKERARTKPSTTHAFEELGNLVLSPHRGGAVGLPETEEARLDALCRALAAAAARGVEALPGRIHLHTKKAESG